MDADELSSRMEIRCILQHLARLEQQVEQMHATAAQLAHWAMRSSNSALQAMQRAAEAQRRAQQAKEDLLKDAMPTADAWTLEITAQVLRQHHLLVLAWQLALAWLSLVWEVFYQWEDERIKLASNSVV
jgi:hypothetical protein